MILESIGTGIVALAAGTIVVANTAPVVMGTFKKFASFLPWRIIFQRKSKQARRIGFI